MDGEEDELTTRRDGHQAELLTYRRFLRCMGILLISWFVMLYFIAHHENGLVVAVMVVICLWIVYMCVCICGSLYLRFREEATQNDEEVDGEDAGLTAGGRDSALEETETFSYSFDETAKRIRSCPDPIAPGRGPTNGIYTAVFSAVIFNKAMRSEGKVRLEFLPTNRNGWTVQGESNFGRTSHAIKDGFVNSNGEMFWKTGDTIHRGVLDFQSSSMFDGEFLANRNGILSNKRGPVGRIVRLELATASFYSSVEMVSFTSDDNGDDDGQLDNEEGGLFT